MSYLSNAATAANILSNHTKLEWAKWNLDAGTYGKIKKSYNDIIKYTVITTVILTIIVFIAITMAFSAQASVRSAYSTWKIGHASEDKVWYINNIKYEVNMSDYGYDAANFSVGDNFRVYLDQNDEVIKISSDDDVNKLMEDDLVAVVMVGSLLFMIVVLLCIHVPIAFNTYGKIWRKYGVWFEKADVNNDIFIV